jgi:glycosyltransferase involved in cell wall biosynthesis
MGGDDTPLVSAHDGAVNVSVIIPAYNARGSIERCLASLEAQKDGAEFEVILVVSSRDGTAELARARFPKVQLFVLPERAWPGDARNVGVRRSHGEILAFLDADSVVDDDWIVRVVRAHGGAGRALVCGVLTNGNTDSAVEWAFYFCALSAWMPGTPTQEMTDIAAGSLTMKRWVFDRFGPFLEGSYSSDTAFYWRAAAGGVRPLRDPSLIVHHASRIGLAGFVRHRFIRGKAFARVRVSEQQVLGWRRIAYAVLSPALPLILWMRTVRRVLANSQYRPKLLSALPLIALGHGAWSLGECAGYLSVRGRRQATGPYE